MRLEMQIVLPCFQYTNGGVDSIPALPQHTLRAFHPGYGAVEMKQKKKLSLHFIEAHQYSTGAVVFCFWTT